MLTVAVGSGGGDCGIGVIAGRWLLLRIRQMGTDTNLLDQMPVSWRTYDLLARGVNSSPMTLNSITP